MIQTELISKYNPYIPDFLMCLPQNPEIQKSIESETIAMAQGAVKVRDAFDKAQAATKNFIPGVATTEKLKIYEPVIDEYCGIIQGLRKNVEVRLKNVETILNRKVDPPQNLSELQELLLFSRQAEIRRLLRGKSEGEIYSIVKKEIESGGDYPVFNALKNSPLPILDKNILKTFQRMIEEMGVEKWGAEQEKQNYDLMIASVGAFNLCLDGAYHQILGWLKQDGQDFTQGQKQSFWLVKIEN